MSASLRLLVGCSLLALGACGQKGALYLPEPAHEVVPAAAGGTSTAATPSDPEADTQKDKESQATKPNTGAL
jgi:predicted small lipoprotein YifL